MKQKDDILLDLEKIEVLFDGPEANLKAFLEELHPTEIAFILELLKEKKRHRIIHLLPIDIASEAISEMDPESHPEKLLESLHSDLVTNIVEELSYDDATDIVSQLSVSKRDEILDRIDVEDAAEIRKLLVYPEDTAGGLMTTEIVKIHCSLTKKEALEEVALQSEEIEAFYAIYVVDDADRLVGTVSLKNLIKAKAHIRIDALYDEELIYVETDTDQEEVAQMLSQYNLPGIPVVDKNNILLGVVTFDDVIDVLEEETTEDILKIANVSAFEADMKKSEMKRVLGKWSLTAIGIGAIIGGGIFVLTGTGAYFHAGPALALSFVIAGIACVFAALCYSEFASMIPVEGSAYAYAYGTIGEMFAWIIGWGLVLEYAMGSMTVAVSWRSMQ